MSKGKRRKPQGKAKADQHELIGLATAIVSLITSIIAMITALHK